MVKFTDILMDCTASFFRIEEKAMQEAERNQSSAWQ
jgi:hypothetical protein